VYRGSVTEEITCPKCGITPQHPDCDGEGNIHDTTDDLMVRVCPYMRARIIAKHLGAEIWNVKAVPNGSCPLLEMGERGKPPVLDRTAENLHLRIRWPNLLPHLKFALGCKGPNFPFRVITDQEIKNVYVGNEHYGVRAKSRRDDVETYNSLSDFAGDAYDLVILKLGYIGHPNRAAAGALKETLLIREALHKATWIVHDPEHSWTHSCDENVEDYIGTRFETVALDPADPGEHYQAPDTDVGMEAHESEEPEEEYAQEQPVIDIEASFDLPGESKGGRR
jgi:hypothetical protein